MTTAHATDVEIQEDVLAELDFEHRVRPNEIGVRVHDGIVTLLGSVDSYAKRVAAQEAAHRVRGVRGVANELEIQLGDEDVRSDEAIAQAAATALTWDVMVPQQQIELTVDHGWVTLGGEVAHQYQREAAQADVQRLTGVRGVSNQICLVAPDLAGDVQRQIAAALVRSAAADAEAITATVDGHTVTLTGHVRTWAEKQDAERVAWSVPGITVVKNALAVIPARR
jgi:osmotically-inducible protein OsmY